MQIFTSIVYALRKLFACTVPSALRTALRNKETQKKIAMRLQVITLFMIVGCIQVGAKSFGQQRVSLNFKDASVDRVFNQISEQTHYGFWYNKSELSPDIKITVNLKDANLQEALELIFKDQPMTFKLVGKYIVVKPKAPTILQKISEYLKKIEVRGMVTGEQGEPLPGVNVSIKGVATVTSTDENGNYRIDAEENATLVFSYIGYKNQQIAINGRNQINVQLSADIRQLSEMAIKGYYNTPKTLNTGDVSTLKGTDIAKQPVSDPIMALEGRIPGLYVSQSSGVVGAPLTVRLRGQNSIANGNSPFYIVDGVPFPSASIGAIPGAGGLISPFASIRPNDIESITVLKDADATAIYGSRGANGVILITTKKAKAGRTKAEFNVYTGTAKITNKLKLMNTAQYLEMRNEAFKNDGGTPGATDYDVNGTWDQSRNTDWQDVLIGSTARFTDAQGTLSGGNENTQFALSAGYRKETTVFPGDYGDKKGSARLSINHQSEDKKFSANAVISYLNDNNNLPNADLTTNIFLAPNAPSIYKDNGDLNWQNSTWKNPFGLLRKSTTTISDNLNSNLILQYDLPAGFQIKSSFGYTNIGLLGTQINPFSALDPTTANPANNRSYSVNTNSLKTWIVEPQLNYTKRINKHQVDVLLATTFQENNQRRIMQSASGYTSDALIENLAAATSVINSSVYTQYKYNAVFARIGYNFDEKYVLNLTGRRDGSSRFGPGKQFGNFGAIGAAWNFSKEKFINERLPFLSFGKLRGSIGSTGNDQLEDYKFLDTYTSNSLAYLGNNGISPTQLTNSEFGWETIKKIEVAVELGFFKDRVQLNANWYQNRTGNQLVGYPLPAITGFTTVQANLPAVIENKGFELDLTTVNLRNSKLTWTSSFNISFPKNKLVSYPNLAASSYSSTYVIGEPLFINMLYHYTGIDPQTGVYTFEDYNKDNSITSTFDRIPVFVGQKFFGGFNNSLTYKGFSLDVFVQFVKQTGYNYLTNSLPGAYSSSSTTGNNQLEVVMDRWQNPGDERTFEKYTRLGGAAFTANTNLNVSDARISDASFIRLKNISLTYQLPEKWISKIGLSNGRLYLQGQNLATITNYKGLDPENSRPDNTIPLAPLRLLTIGTQLTF
ncbi:SusC/RagA family TonB-linked outer membrane protein [Mucilaginibacter paludis]|uniref:TonB-dependent receptor plug n=1 Tax=Mucilaginibacter paludis DSM 18603 TaxID=714943 RepID=H1YBV4_9SPHI|nr:SusC/RagA family TonB-linked outer membrane protein [Mucilaginibacter paludis]EHQ27032.1 TonB-dependent receptor plug [Mucilaginibacter paludis DSM 18603]